jgi:hypothetical protein
MLEPITSPLSVTEEGRHFFFGLNDFICIHCMSVIMSPNLYVILGHMNDPPISLAKTLTWYKDCGIWF